MADLSLKYLLFGEDRSASKTVEKVGDTANKASSKFKAGFALAGAAAGVAVGKFAMDSVAAYKDSEKSQQELAFAFEKFPKLADTNMASLQGLNAALAKKTIHDDDAMASGQAVLAQFGLTGKQLKGTTPLLLDYASKMGKDLPSAATDVGKALGGNAKALKNIGISYKSTGDKTKDYENVTKLMAAKVGGFAEKEAQTAAGKTKILGNQFGELQETVGSKLVPGLGKLTDIGLKVVAWISDNQTKAIILAGGLGALAAVIGVVTVATKLMAVASNAAVVASNIAAGASKVWAAAQWLVNVAMIANPIGLIIAAVVALVAIIVLIATKTTWFQTIWKAMTTGIGVAWQWLWNSVLQPVIQFILNGFAGLTRTIGNVLVALGNLPGFGWAKTAGEKMLGAADSASKLAANINKIPNKKKVSVDLSVTALASNMTQALSHNIGIRAVRERGGPVLAGQAYIVGEKRPEVFVPDTNGTILPRVGVPGGGAGGAGGSGSQPLVINQYLDGRLVHQSLLALKRTTGGGLGLEVA